MGTGFVALPSALLHFTSVFGMGTGGSVALWPPDLFGLIYLNKLLSVSSLALPSNTPGLYGQASRFISTG